MLRQPGKSTRSLALSVALCFFCAQVTWVRPGAPQAAPPDDLKKIEYKYYFRGDYATAIAQLRTFLDRKDLSEETAVEAREYLAASLILSGASDQGKAEYVQLLKSDSSYPGPDPSVFKAIIITTYEEAKAEYSSLVIRNAPATKASKQAAGMTQSATGENTGKPIYKKWWFYATMGAAVLLVAGAASNSGGDNPPPNTGTVTVDVGIR
jgi:hypothetical protein